MSEAKNECMVLADEKNITFIEYESPFGMVRLDANVVRKYFVRGNGKITDGEVVMYLEQCKRHKLDPFAINEVFLIKYSDTDYATMVIGYNTFKRRAEESKDFLNFEAGIVVQRGNDIIKKEGLLVQGKAEDELVVNKILIPEIIKDRVQITLILRVNE